LNKKLSSRARGWWLAALGGLLVTSAHAQVTNWTNAVAGSDSTENARKVLVDASGNILVLATVNNTNSDIRVVKYNVGGTQLWTRTINGSGNDVDFANDMALDAANNVYVVGAVNGNTGYAAKLNAANGTVAWSYTEGTTFSPFYSVAVNAAGNVAVGMVRNTSGDQYAVRQLNGTTGASIWDVDVSSASIAGAQPRVITDGTNNTLLVTESNITRWSSAGVQGWQQSFTVPIDPMGIAVRDAANAVYYVGTDFSGPDQDWYIVRRALDTGALVYGRLTNFDASGDDTPSALRLDGAGNPIVVGTVFNSFGHTDAAVVCYQSNNGNVAWINSYNSPTNANDFANNLIIDGSSNIYMIGTTRTPTRYDVLIRRMNGLGQTAWTTTLNNSTFNGNDFGRAINLDAAGHVYALGMYQRAVGNEARLTRLQNATLTPASPNVIGGNAVSWTLALNSQNPTSRVFTLTSSSPAGTVPASVTMPASAVNVTFSMSTTGVAVPTPVTVTAGGSVVGTVTLNPPTPASVIVNPGDIVSGTSTTGTVNINGKAPAGGWTVFVRDNSSAVSLPSTVLIDAGATFAQFDISTVPTAVDVPATITATSGGGTATTTLQVRRASLTSVSVSSASVTGGTPVTGRLVLSGIAGANFAVTLNSNNTNAAVMPSSSIVTRNFQEGTFPITTKAVGADASVTITAVLNGVTRTTTLNVLAPVLTSVSGSPQSVPGGTGITGTLTLSNVAPATGTFPVTLSSANPAVQVPATVNLANNSSTTNFAITTSPVASTVAVTISATFNGVTKTGSVTARASGLASVDFLSDSVKGGFSTTGIIRMDGRVGAGGIFVTLVSSNPAVAAVPATVRIPAGATSASFTVTTTAVGADTTVTISATRNAITKTADIVVFP
jgi:hypothetical protein